MKVPSIAFAVVMAAAVPVAHADSALRPERIPNKARALAEQGRAYHETGHYDAAVAAFKEAYVLAPSPSLLFNIAQSYRLAGNCDEAAWMYRRFLDTNPMGDHRQLAHSHLTTVEKCGTGGLRVTTPVAKKDDARVPDPAIDLVSRPVHDDRSRTYKQLAIGTAVGSGALLAGAAFFALDASAAEDTVNEAYKRGGKWADIEAANRRGERSSSIATVLGIGGGLAAVSSVVFYAVGRHHDKPRHVSVAPTAGGAQVSMSWRF